MQYILQNKVNYYTSNKNIVFDNNIEYIDQAYIIYTNDGTNSNNSFIKSSFYQNIYKTQTGTSFVIYSDTVSKYVNNIIFVVKPTFTCSDITLISDKQINHINRVTFTVSYTLANNTTVTKEYTFPLDQQFMNTYNLYDCINIKNTIKSFTISATSDSDLTLLAPKIIVADGGQATNVTVIYL